MNKAIILILFCSLIPCISLTKNNPDQVKVTLVVSNIRNHHGSLRIGFYRNKEEYKKEDAPIKKIVAKKNISGSAASIEILLPEGTYACALLDDENDNGKMDFRFFMPSEGYGFSNIIHQGLTMPDFEKISFRISKGASNVVHVKAKYL